MKVSYKKRFIIIETVALLYIALFVYAAISKLIDFQNFKTELGQSPLLSPFADYIAPSVIAIELFIALLLAIPGLRLVSLFMSFSLMTMFTTYIYIILNYSSFIPCSCGGILSKLGWNDHLIFNIIFIVLGAVGIILLATRSNSLINQKA